MKRINLDENSEKKFEAGLIAQEIYYGCPELRYIVHVPKDATPLEDVTLSEDPTIDPDYGFWGEMPASIDYGQLIPYLVEGVNDLNKQLQIEKAKNVLIEERLAMLEAASSQP